MLCHFQLGGKKKRKPECDFLACPLQHPSSREDRFCPVLVFLLFLFFFCYFRNVLFTLYASRLILRALFTGALPLETVATSKVSGRLSALNYPNGGSSEIRMVRVSCRSEGFVNCNALAPSSENLREATPRPGDMPHLEEHTLAHMFGHGLYAAHFPSGSRTKEPSGNG